MHPNLSRTIYRAVGFLSGLNVYKYLKELEKTQWLPQEELKEFQADKLERLFQHAYKNVPYYRRKFRELGISPEELKKGKALAKLPLLTKDDVRQNFTALRAENIRKVIPDFTSGSTGMPLAFLKDPSTSGHFLGAKYRGHRWHGINIGDREAKFWGLPLDRLPKYRERCKDFILNRTLFIAFDISSEALRERFHICQKIKPRYLYGYASALYRFAAFLKSESLDASSLKLKAIISTSEVLYDFEQKLIEAVFACSVGNEYGSCEAGIIAFGCPAGGMHISQENVYLEILRPDNRPVSPGETGKVVLTTLDNYAMPFIRYDIGDLAVAISPEEQCKCGRGLSLLGEITGRALDTAITPNGKTVHAHIFNFILRSAISHGADIKEFKVVQKKPDELLLRIVSRKELKQKGRDYITQEINKLMGKGIKITFEQVPSIPLEPSGKLRFFASEIVELKKESGSG